MPRKKGRTIRVHDEKCLGRHCLQTHELNIRGQNMDGSSKTLYVMHDRCAWQHNRGCPIPYPEPDPELAEERSERWVVSKEAVTEWDYALLTEKLVSVPSRKEASPPLIK